MNPGPTRTDQDFHALCHEQMEEDDPDLLVAIRYATRKRRGQRNTKERRRKLQCVSGSGAQPTHRARIAPIPHKV